MITINKSLLSNAVDSMNHAINAIVDAADAIAAIAIDMVEQVFAAFEFEPQVAAVQQPVIESDEPEADNQQCVYVPVRCYAMGGYFQYEVFTSKWEGKMITAESLVELAALISSGSGIFIADDGEVCRSWFCATPRVAIMRAKGAQLEWDPNVLSVTSYAIKIQP